MNKQHTVSSRRARGFTLIEMMVAVAVLGVLLAIAGPTFSDIIRNNRTAAEANELVGALTIARNEAAKRGLPITLCAASADQTACAGDAVGEWDNGWLVFVDANGTAGTLDTASGDVLLQTSRRVNAALRLRTNSVGFVRYGRSGALTNASAFAAGTTVARFELQHSGCTGNNLRVLQIDRTGRVNLTRIACT